MTPPTSVLPITQYRRTAQLVSGQAPTPFTGADTVAFSGIVWNLLIRDYGGHSNPLAVGDTIALILDPNWQRNNSNPGDAMYFEIVVAAIANGIVTDFTFTPNYQTANGLLFPFVVQKQVNVALIQPASAQSGVRVVFGFQAAEAGSRSL